jgi:hypothetical protein
LFIGILKSKVVVACVSQTYQESAHCMFELREARNLGETKPIVTLVLEDDPFGWVNPELSELCQVTSNMFVNIGQLANQDWDSDDGPTSEMIAALHKSLEPLIKLLNDLGCRPGVE